VGIVLVATSWAGLLHPYPQGVSDNLSDGIDGLAEASMTKMSVEEGMYRINSDIVVC
jgi:hypothetical protein